MCGSRLDRIQIFSYQEWTWIKIFNCPLISAKFKSNFRENNWKFALALQMLHFQQGCQLEFFKQDFEILFYF